VELIDIWVECGYEDGPKVLQVGKGVMSGVGTVCFLNTVMDDSSRLMKSIMVDD
jgi:hypothetical protein